MNQTTPGIVTRKLSRRFGSVEAVVDLDLNIPQGEIYGFLGPNGAGKSTTTQMLCTLLRPSSGEGRVAGCDINTETAKLRLRIGATLQDTALDEKLTGRETLTYQGRFYGLSRAAIRRRIEEVSPILEVSALDRRVGTYSGGMKRRLDVAASLIHNPSILFLDEPTTGLDPMSRAEVWAQVRRLNSTFGVTIFLTTQYLEEADALADRVGIMDEGRLRAEGTPEELKRSIGSDVISVKVGDRPTAQATEALSGLAGVAGVEFRGGEVTVACVDGAAAISPVAVALAATDLQVMEISLHKPTLDDVFLHLTGRRIQQEGMEAGSVVEDAPAGTITDDGQTSAGAHGHP